MAKAKSVTLWLARGREPYEADAKLFAVRPKLVDIKRWMLPDGVNPYAVEEHLASLVAPGECVRVTVTRKAACHAKK